MKHDRNEDFFGQEDILRQIDNALLPLTEAANSATPKMVQTFTLCGMGGLDRTEIAIEYMHLKRNNFDAIFWVNADTNQKLAADFKDIAQKLGLEDDKDSTNDPVETREIVKGWLSNPVGMLSGEPTTTASETKWLLILDNADDPDILNDYGPAMGTGSVLITSRNPIVKDGVYMGSARIDLPSMPAKDAGAFLHKISGRQTEKNSFNLCIQIAETLGGLPLAIIQIGSIIRRQHLSLKDLIEYYEEDAKTLHETSVPGLTYNQTIASVWAVDSLPSQASALLRVISMLDPDGIPEEVLTKGAERVILDQYPKKKTDYFRARAELIRTSLITRNFEREQLRIHRLVQDVVRHKMPIDESRMVFDDTVILLSSIWPFLNVQNLNDVGRNRKAEYYSPHIERLKHLLETDLPLDKLQPQIDVTALFNEAAW